jgi:hypothetical protein
MGRPLKIAKAQAVIRITNTTATTNVITSNANFTTLGIIAGMQFVPASSIGGLVANVSYWILRVLTSGVNSTFTASSTPLNANPTSTAVALSTASGTIATTIAPVDAYFNNPAGPQWPSTNSNTYSVVGGNTAIIGKQVLAQVAIGINGTGTLYGDTGNLNVYGSGTDFANTLSVGSAIQVASANINGGTDYTTVGFVGTNTGYITVAVANTNATGNVIRTSGNAQTLFVGAPVIFSANTGGLVTGSTYFVKTIANVSAFTVSNTQYGATKAVTTGTTAANARIDVTSLAATPPANFVGASFVYANDEAGYIVRQKGKQKYLVTGATSGLTSQCFTANLANTALTPNTMRILATYANSTTQTVQSLSDHTVELFTSTSGPVATGNIVAPGQPTGNLGFINSAPAFATFNSAITTVAPSAFVAGTTYVIATLGNTNWTAVGAPGGYAVGTVFTATASGSGTGTAYIGGVPYPIVTIASA